METQMSARELYERGRMRRQAKLFDRALPDLKAAAHDPRYVGKAYVQVGLCFRAMGRHEEAAAALRQALDSSTLSFNEYLHTLYLLGLTLELLGHYAAAVEAYGWVRHADATFRDVNARIRQLCALESGMPSQPPIVRRTPTVQRRHDRVAIHCRSQFASKTGMVAGEGVLRDLSPGGCRVTSSIVVPIGTELACWIFPDNDLKPFTIEGAAVRWRRAHEFGLAFIKLPPAAQRQIAQLYANAM